MPCPHTIHTERVRHEHPRDQSYWWRDPRSLYHWGSLPNCLWHLGFRRSAGREHFLSIGKPNVEASGLAGVLYLGHDVQWEVPYEAEDDVMGVHLYLYVAYVGLCCAFVCFPSHMHTAYSVG